MKYLRPNFIVSRQKELITLINKTLGERGRDSFNKDRARHEAELPAEISSSFGLRGWTSWQKKRCWWGVLWVGHGLHWQCDCGPAKSQMWESSNKNEAISGHLSSDLQAKLQYCWERLKPQAFKDELLIGSFYLCCTKHSVAAWRYLGREHVFPQTESDTDKHIQQELYRMYLHLLPRPLWV